MAVPENESPHDRLERVSNERLAACRVWKDLWVIDFKECYFFSAPHRQRQISSQTKPATQRLLDAQELQTSLAFDLCQEFVTEVINTFMPEAQEWCERGKGLMVPQQIWDQVSKQVKDDDLKIFETMKASNLYPELAKAFYPDLAIGTVGLWIENIRPHEPIVVLAVPLREMEINLGPFGEIDDRFVVRFTRNANVRAIIGKTLYEKIKPDTRKVIESKPADYTEIRWGFWRLWDREDDEVWQHVVLVGKELIHETTLEGEGSCPFIVGRFNPSADWPWGLGPLINGLPDLRQIDELEAQKIENVELHLTPPISYPDDSFAAVEQGLEPRMAYPIRPGSQDAIKAIYNPPAPDAAIYQHEEMEHRLRRLFFVDFPEQSGDTPPTLGQWLDELARAQRRIGTPGMPFWREVAAKIFLRFKFVMEQLGAIQPISVDGKRVALMPYNPAQRAAEQQDIALATRFAQIMSEMFPEEWKAVVDGRATMQAFMDKMRVDKLIKLRSPEDMQKFISMIAPLVGARHSANPDPGQAPAQQGLP